MSKARLRRPREGFRWDGDLPRSRSSRVSAARRAEAKADDTFTWDTADYGLHFAPEFLWFVEISARCTTHHGSGRWQRSPKLRPVRGGERRPYRDPGRRAPLRRRPLGSLPRSRRCGSSRRSPRPVRLYPARRRRRPRCLRRPASRRRRRLRFLPPSRRNPRVRRRKPWRGRLPQRSRGLRFPCRRSPWRTALRYRCTRFRRRPADRRCLRQNPRRALRSESAPKISLRPMSICSPGRQAVARHPSR